MMKRTGGQKSRWTVPLKLYKNMIALLFTLIRQRCCLHYTVHVLFFELVKQTVIYCTKYFKKLPFSAVQNERQPRNTATIRPESLKDMDAESILREATVAVGAFG